MSEKKPRKQARGPHPYSSDRPIRFTRDDILGRTPFAIRLAADIHSWNGDDSLVIALYGSWGSGKTSVKNMILEANRKRKQVSLTVVDFNPWQLSGTGGIPASFFREIGLALKQEGPERDIEKRSKKWNAYASALTVAGTAAQWIGKALPLGGVPGGPVVESVGGAIKAAGVSASEGSEALKAKSEATAKSLELQKKELAALLARLPQPLLVVIDDIDRLTTDEILQIFQLVKANADFPQLIYLLLFERQIVAKALNQISGDKGMEFLEKIIQVGYHVPQASRGAVQRVLLTGLDQHLEKTPASKYWNKHRWSDLYVEGISGYFKNLRHVYRFLASFTFHMQHHRSGNSIEVNPMDLIGLETLRVFEPGVYERLSGAKAILTRYEGKGFFGEIKQEVVNQAVSEIVSASPLENQSKVREILNALFPPISPEFAGKDAVTPHHQEWLRELRVCHPDLFDKYFTLTIADEDISQAELDRFVALTSDATKFQTACEALKKRGLLNLAFERLDAYKAQIPLEAMPSLILALCNMSDSFPERGGKSFGQMFEHDLSAYAWRLCYFGLKREPDAKRRYQILHDVVSRSSGLALPFELVSLDDRVGDREARGYDFLLDQGDVKALKTVCVQKFRVALKIKNPSVRQSQQFRVILLRWSSWESTDEVKCLVHDQIRTPKDALWLLTVLLGESHSYGRDHRVCYSITLGLLERFTDIAHLTQLVAKLGLNSLSKRETIALREFDKALKRRAEGKPDIVGDASHDPDEEVVE